MPAATVSASAQPAQTSAPKQGAPIPFQMGSHEYSELVTTIDHEVKPNEGRDYTVSITPGGFLRGVRILVRSEGGSLGQGQIPADNPWSLITSVGLVNIDGSSIKFPMSGYAYYLENKWLNPQYGLPEKFDSFKSGINPSFDLKIFPEIGRHTMGVLANSDARATYRLNLSVGAGHPNLATGNVSKWPTLHISVILETWGQTDQQDITGTPIEPLPPGLAVASIVRHEVKELNAANSNNIIKLNNVGNEYRGLVIVTRDSTGERVDLFGDPVRFRMDNLSVWTRSPDSWFSWLRDHYQFLNLGIAERERGVYVIPMFRDPITGGSFWVPTTNASYVVLEASTVPSAKNMPGTAEVISGEVIPVQGVPTMMEGS